MKVLVLTITLLTTNAFAQNLFSFQDPTKRSSVSAGQCTDYTGTYSGVCTGSQGATNAVVAISQYGCEGISINGIYYPIGGTHQVQDIVAAKGGDYVASSTTNVNWDANRHFLGSVTRYAVTQAGRILYGDTYYGSLYLNGNTLSTSLKGLGTYSACTLQR